MKVALWIVLLALVPLVGRAQLSPVERRGLIEALYLGNLTEDDLRFTRRPAILDPLSLPLVIESVDDPIEGANRLLGLHQSGKGSLAQMLRRASSEGFGDPTDLKTVTPKPLVVPDSVPLPIRPAVAQLAADIDEANTTIRTSLARLSPDERRDIMESLPRWACPDPTFAPDFAKRPQISQKQLLALVKKVDLAAIRFAGRKLATGVEAELPALKKGVASVTAPIFFTVHGVVVEITGRGDDVHSKRNTNLCIDLGGDNLYKGRYGAGVGYASVLIDLGRHNRVIGPDANIGAGILGIGLAYFAGEGNCDFRGGALSFGVGFAGVGGLSKHDGEDRYTATDLSEGAAAFGIGILLDSGGDDLYTAKTGAQGFARTGGLGWLIDQEGNDVYRTDCGQGFGGGVATADGQIPGGIGLLTDLAGSDFYFGGARCQACGEFGGLGSLFDGSGNDTYTALDEGQACAQHQAAAYLFDLAGDDSYSLHGGVGHSSAIDHAISFFLDRAGNDLYSSLDARPGTAITGAVALFLDASGNDRYQGDVTVSFPSRGPTSIGLFADLGGADEYGSGESFEGQATVLPGRKIAYDSPTPADTLAIPVISDHKFPRPGSVPAPSAKVLEKLYQGAAVGGPIPESLDSLVAIGEPAFDWLLIHKLDSDEEYRNRPFLALASALGSQAQVKVAAAIDDPDPSRALGALRICMEGDFGEAKSHLKGALQRPLLQQAAVVAAGQFGAKEAIGDLLTSALNLDHLLAYDALTSLAELRSTEGIRTAQSYLGTSDLCLRDGAIAYLLTDPVAATSAARVLLSNPDERQERVGIEILSKVGSAESLDLIATYLNKGTMGLKIQALLALDGRCPTAARSAYLALREDPNSLIKAIAARTDPGR